MKEIPKDSYCFYFSPPMDRLQQNFTIGWAACWDNNLYSDYEEVSWVNYNGCPNLGDATKKVLEFLEENFKEAFNGRSTSSKKTEKFITDNFLELFSRANECRIHATTTKELINNIVNSERTNCPPFVKDELKKLIV